MGIRTGMSLWFEIAPPQIITVERCSPKQRTLETILEKVATMGLPLETAPPQIITVERCSPRPSTLDTIVEESVNMAGHLASAATDVSIPMTLKWENTANPRLAAPGVLACN